MPQWALPDGLPPGRPVVPAGGTEPVMWVSDRPVPDAGEQWIRLFDERTESGLYPLLLETRRGEPPRPWHTGELWPVPVSRIDGLDAAELMRRRWTSRYPPEDHPDQPWPGMAPAGTPLKDPDEQARQTARDLAGGGPSYGRDGWYLGLVPVSRGADAPAVCGWDGAANHWGNAEISAMLRSWEDRFGARLIGAGFDSLHLSLAAPPLTAEQALPLAHELMVFSPMDDYLVSELVEGVEMPDGNLGGSIIGQTRHSFWWD